MNTLSGEVNSVPEKDKPFYIAILLIIMLGTVIVIGGIGAFYGSNLVLEYIDKIFASVLTLVASVSTYYFGTKANSK